MKKNKKILLVIVVILFIIVLTIILKKYLIFRYENNIIEAAGQYFDDEEYVSVTSVQALMENDYLSSKYEKSKCYIIEKKEKILKKEEDCDRALELSKVPIVIINYTFNGQEVNKNDVVNDELTISFTFRNDKNKYYNMNDVTEIEWIDDNNEVLSNENTLVIEKKNINALYRLNIIFKEKEYNVVKSFFIKMDIDSPVLMESDIKGRIPYVFYQDNSGIDDIYYYVTTSPLEQNDYSLFSKKINTDFSCDGIDSKKYYYFWSYATDMAGNRSNIDYIGVFEKECND